MRLFKHSFEIVFANQIHYLILRLNKHFPFQERTPWAAYKDLIQVPGTTIQVKDFSCPQFEALVKHNTVPGSIYHQMRLLFEMLEREWRDKYSR